MTDPTTPRVVRRKVQRETVERWKTPGGCSFDSRQEAESALFQADWQDSGFPCIGAIHEPDKWAWENRERLAAFFAAGASDCADSADCAGQVEDRKCENQRESLAALNEAHARLKEQERTLRARHTECKAERDALKAEVERLEADLKRSVRIVGQNVAEVLNLTKERDALAARVRELEARERQLTAAVRGLAASCLHHSYHRQSPYYIAEFGLGGRLHLMRSIGWQPDPVMELPEGIEHLPAAAVDLLMGDATDGD